jgi:hypothetical protein
MNCVRGQWLMAIPLFLLVCLPAGGQTSTTEFLPEIDANFRLNSNERLIFQAKQTREGGAPTQAEVGPTVEFYLKPLLKLKNVTLSIWTMQNPSRYCWQSDTALCRRRASPR